MEKLSTTLTSNDLSICINEYFTALINCITSWSGDVLKFAGDAVFVSFPPTSPSTEDPILRLALAARCAEAIVTTLSDYKPTLSDHKLNVHCGVAFAAGKFHVVGAPNIPRAEILLVGEVISAVAEAEVQAGLGEVYCCPATQQALGSRSSLLCSRTSPLNINLYPDPPPAKSIEQKLTASQQVSVALKPFAHETVIGTLEDGGTLQPELRPVYTIFLKAERPPGTELNQEFLQRIMEISGEEVALAGGNIRQFILDDKGMVLIFTFGLLHAVFKGMAQGSIMFSASLADRLFGELGLRIRIGITFGHVYCGIVGSPTRHEFAVMGSTVNLAARLMCSKCDDNKAVNIVIDEATVDNSIKSNLQFEPLEPITAKGFSEKVKIFTIVTSTRKPARRASTTIFTGASFSVAEGEVVNNFVGRSKELYDILEAKEEEKARFLTLVGEGGIGKSTLALKVVEEMKDRCEEKILVLSGQCDGRGILPFSATKRIVVSLLKELKADSVRGVKKLAEELGFASDIVLPTLNLFGLSMEGGEGKVVMKDIVSFVAALFTLPTPRKIIVLDDAHDIDTDSLALLRSISQMNQPITGILTSRRTDGPNLTKTYNLPPFTEATITQMLLAEMLSSGSTNATKTTMPKKKMPEKKPKKKRASMTDKNILSSSSSSEGNHKRSSLAFSGASVSADLLQITGGNPLFLSEVVELILHTDLITRGGFRDAVEWREDKKEEREAMLDVVCSFNNVSELILSKLDVLSGETRFFIQEAAVIGRCFSVRDMHLLGWNEQDIEDCVTELEEAGIVEEDEERATDNRMMDAQEDVLNVPHYKFSHQVYASSIYNKQLSNVVSKVHLRYATQLALHQKALNQEPTNSSLAVQLQHLSATTKFCKSAAVATVLAERYSKLALYEYAITCCGLALATKSDEEEDEAEACVSRIRLIVQQAKCHLSLSDKKKGTELYEEAKSLYDQGFAGGIVQDASIVFPIISGLTLALKWGTIRDDENATFEKNLVNAFIESAHAFGDMAHVTRALALKGVMNQRLGLWEKALEAEDELEECYDVSLTSKICEAYGSDRAAQSVTLSPQWVWVMEGKKATQRVEQALNKGVALLERPELERRNVHNKVMMLFPLIALWFSITDKREENMTRAKSLWQKHVVDAIEEFYDKESKIFFTSLLLPMKFFLDLAVDAEVCAEEVGERREFLLDMMESRSLEDGTFQTMDESE
ncbi:hypothetical protein TrRE_jg3657 [Triparma retinervis]|uniref:Guanylate cyclase domain-containing protein n=1 Tax=Triparma retinervis TaxID=2557542 RepID=A0A9W6ZWP6_9STRA|nr:hypothetical protein TrRE_jg3657 [Triparma retinervis]